MKRFIIAIFLILTIVITIYYQFNNSVPVQAAEVSKKDLPLYINLSGNLSFSKKIEIYPKISGIVKEVKVKAGDKVKKGEILAILEAEDLKRQIDQIKNLIDLIKISNAFNSLNLQPNKTNISKDQIETLESYHNYLKELYKERIIKSPINGIVAKINISPGETVKTSQDSMNFNNLLGNFNNLLSMFNISLPVSNPAFTLIDPNSLIAILKVDENNILKIKEGQQAKINVDALDQNPWYGKVSSVSKIPSLNKDGSYAYEVTIPLPRLGEKVVEGMNISATINIGTKKNVITIPLNAIVFKEGKTYVFLYENGRAKQKEVIIGDMTMEEIEIKEGLKEGDLIIVSPLDKISDNTKVTLKDIIKK